MNPTVASGSIPKPRSSASPMNRLSHWHEVSIFASTHLECLPSSGRATSAGRVCSGRVTIAKHHTWCAGRSGACRTQPPAQGGRGPRAPHVGHAKSCKTCEMMLRDCTSFRGRVSHIKVWAGFVSSGCPIREQSGAPLSCVQISG